MENKQNYETPFFEIVELEMQRFLCDSNGENGGGSDPLNPGGNI